MATRTTPVNPGNRRTRPGKRTTKNSTSTARDIALAERRAKVVELRRSALSFDEIAQQIRARPDTPKGYDRASAYRDFRMVLDALMDEPGREVLAGELDRLNATMGVLWPKVADGDYNAIDRMLKVMDQRARYLGLYSPVQHQFFGADGGPVQVSNVTDPNEVYTIARAALADAITDYQERQAPRQLEAPA